MKLRNLICFVCLGIISSSFAQQSATKQLADYVKRINRFATECPQEKVYLHFDNTGYYVGDTIWFKAYTVYAETVKPTTLSRVLHVELVTPRGEVVDSRKLKIENGQCHGEFALSRDYRGGFYEVRAYTRGMLNFGDDYIFSRVFPVYSEPEVAGNYEEKEMDSFFGERKERPSSETYDKVNITFFPEGGHAVKGLRSRIAFRATGKNGEDIAISGNLYNKAGEPVAALTTLHQGMGVFELTPEEDEYKAIVEYEGKNYTIPFKEMLPEGYTMIVNNLHLSSLQVTLQKSASLPYDTIAVSVTCRGRVYAVEAFGLGAEPYTFSILKEKFPAGCLQITAFNTDGDILAERLAFHTKQAIRVATNANIVTSSSATANQNLHTVENVSAATNDSNLISYPGMFLPIKMTQDKPGYKSFEEINMEFDIHDHKGNPVETTFSLAIRDAATTPVTAYQDNVLTNLLLSSEVKGYLENPMQYFTDNSRVTRTKLDLLMMVQGWRRYSWQQMAGVKPFEIKHFVEEGLPLWGRVLTLVGNKPRTNADLMFWMKNNKGGEIHGKGHTDEKGSFYCVLPDSVNITGRWLLNVSVSEKGKQKNSQILMNRHFSPKTRSYTYWDTAIRDSITVFAEEEDSLHKPSIMEMQSLKEVQVKRYRPRKRLIPEMVFNVDKEINERLDKGESVPFTVGEYLENHHPVIVYDRDLNVYTYGVMNESSLFFKYVLFRLVCQEKDRPKFRHVLVHEINIESVRSIKIYDKNLLELKERYSDKEEQDDLYLSKLGNQSSTSEQKSNTSSQYMNLEQDMGDSFVEEVSIPDNKKELKAIVIAELYDDVYSDTRKGIRQTYYTGYSPVRECYNLQTSDQAIGNIHYRRTLYWNPDIKTNKDGKASIRLYNNGTCRKMDMSAEGMNGNGLYLLE